MLDREKISKKHPSYDSYVFEMRKQAFNIFWAAVSWPSGQKQEAGLDSTHVLCFFLIIYIYMSVLLLSIYI